MTLTFHLIPHTHWDREWYLPRAGYEARLAPMLTHLLDLLDADPELRFHLDGQTVMVEDFLALHEPIERERLRRRLESAVSGGRLGVGPWYVLADLLLPSGESLIRNLLFGTADARRLGGVAPVLYSPDSFGHPAILPSVAAEFGLPDAVVWRGLGARPADPDLYRWLGPDGRSVVTHHLPPAGYEIGSALLGPGPDLAERWSRVREVLVARARTSQVAVFVGADHHAADPGLARLAAQVGAVEPTARVRLSSLAEYFAAVMAEGPALPLLTGEQRASPGYTWSLQGVAATRARQKRAHGAAELALTRIAEPLGTLAGAVGLGPVIGTAWRRLVQSQFHDTLAGTIVDQAAREHALRLEAVAMAAREVARTALAALVGHDFDTARAGPGLRTPALALWNPAARARAQIVTAELTVFRRDLPVGPPSEVPVRTGAAFAGGHWLGPDGDRVPWQVLAIRSGSERIDAPRHYPDQDAVDRVFVAFRARLPGLGGSVLRLAPAEQAVTDPAPARAGRTWLQAGDLSVRVGFDDGIELRGRAGGITGLLTLEAETDRGDAYTPAILPRTRVTATRVEATRVIAPGPLLAAVADRWAVAGPGGPVTARRVVEVRAGSPLVRVRIDLDHRGADQRIRLRLPIGSRGPILVGSPFGQVLRGPARPDPSAVAEQPVPTAAAQRFVAVRARAGALAVFAPGSFEYEWTADGDLFVTVIRAIGELSRSDLAERPGHAAWPNPIPEAQEPGAHRIDLALALVAPDLLNRPAELTVLWEDAFLPPVAMWFRDFVGEHKAFPGLELDAADLSFEALKPAEDGDGFILRAVNRADRPGRGTWTLPWTPTRAARVRADESAIESIDVLERRVSFAYGPREIVSIRVVPPGS